MDGKIVAMRDDDVAMEDAADAAGVDTSDLTMVDVVMEDVEFAIDETAESSGGNEFERFGEEEASRNGGACRLPLLPSFSFQGFTPQECHFRMAESQFLRMSTNRMMKVTKVEFLKNVILEERFNQKKEEFKGSNIPAEVRFVFHGTDEAAIDRIASEGFKIGGTMGVAIRTGAVFGRGVYTASNPDISMAYCRGSNMMLLSVAMLGDHRHHNYGATRDVLVIKDVRQLLPRYVVHYRHLYNFPR